MKSKDIWDGEGEYRSTTLDFMTVCNLPMYVWKILLCVFGHSRPKLSPRLFPAETRASIRNSQCQIIWEYQSKKCLLWQTKLTCIIFNQITRSICTMSCWHYVIEFVSFCWISPTVADFNRLTGPRFWSILVFTWQSPFMEIQFF